MGLPINQLVVATNKNDILHRFISQNNYQSDVLHHTLSPSMDIMVSSNFERLMFDLYGRDGKALVGQMEAWKKQSGAIETHRWTAARKLFDSYSVNDERTCEVIKEVYDKTEYLVDPHTAIGIEAARHCRRDGSIPMVTLATAHPVKFPEAVEKSGVGITPELPHHLADLYEREEYYEVLPNNLNEVHAYVAKHRRN
jgi:threonine synthase